jgi:hypothetical protein
LFKASRLGLCCHVPPSPKNSKSQPTEFGTHFAVLFALLQTVDALDAPRQKLHISNHVVRASVDWLSLAASVYVTEPNTSASSAWHKVYDIVKGSRWRLADEQDNMTVIITSKAQSSPDRTSSAQRLLAALTVLKT